MTVVKVRNVMTDCVYVPVASPKTSNHPGMFVIVKRSRFKATLCSHQKAHSSVHQFATRTSPQD